MHVKLLKPQHTLRWYYKTRNVFAMQFTAIPTLLHLTRSRETTRNAQVTSFARPRHSPLSTCQTGRGNNFVQTNGLDLYYLCVLEPHASTADAEVLLKHISERARFRPKV